MGSTKKIKATLNTESHHGSYSWEPTASDEDTRQYGNRWNSNILTGKYGVATWWCRLGK